MVFLQPDSSAVSMVYRVIPPAVAGSALALDTILLGMSLVV